MNYADTILQYLVKESIYDEEELKSDAELRKTVLETVTKGQFTASILPNGDQAQDYIRHINKVHPALTSRLKNDRTLKSSLKSESSSNYIYHVAGTFVENSAAKKFWNSKNIELLGACASVAFRVFVDRSITGKRTKDFDAINLDELCTGFFIKDFLAKKDNKSVAEYLAEVPQEEDVRFIETQTILAYYLNCHLQELNCGCTASDNPDPSVHYTNAQELIAFVCYIIRECQGKAMHSAEYKALIAALHILECYDLVSIIEVVFAETQFNFDQTEHSNLDQFDMLPVNIPDDKKQDFRDAIPIANHLKVNTSPKPYYAHIGVFAFNKLLSFYTGGITSDIDDLEECFDALEEIQNNKQYEDEAPSAFFESITAVSNGLSCLGMMLFCLRYANGMFEPTTLDDLKAFGADLVKELSEISGLSIPESHNMFDITVPPDETAPVFFFDFYLLYLEFGAQIFKDNLKMRIDDEASYDEIKEQIKEAMDRNDFNLVAELSQQATNNKNVIGEIFENEYGNFARFVEQASPTLTTLCAQVAAIVSDTSNALPAKSDAVASPLRETPNIIELENQISNLQGDLNDLYSELSEQKDKNAQLWRSTESKQELIDSQAAELYQLKKINEQLTLQSRHYHTATATKPVDETLNTVRKLMDDANNCSYTEMLDALKSLYGDDILILPNAYASAEESLYPDRDGVWDALTKLMSGYRQTILSGRPDAEARKHFPQKMFAANESKTQSSSTKSLQKRTVMIDGEKHVFEKHLRMGTATGQAGTIRVYFKLLDDGRMVILHCGEHF